MFNSTDLVEEIGAEHIIGVLEGVVQQGVRIIGVFGILCVFYDEINIFQRVINLLLSIEITKFKNWYVDNRLNFFLVSEFCVDTGYRGVDTPLVGLEENEGNVGYRWISVGRIRANEGNVGYRGVDTQLVGLEANEG